MKVAKDEAAETTQQQETAEVEEHSYTQAEVDKLVKDAVAQATSKFADYKTLKADSDELKKLRDADKTELERAQERATAAEKERDALMAERDVAQWKLEVSEETGIPADILKGATREDIEAHAEQLKPYFNTDAAPVIKSDGYKAHKTAGLTTAQQFAQILDDIL